MCRVVCFIAFRCSQVSNICVNSCESLSCCQLLQNWKRPRSFVLDWAGTSPTGNWFCSGLQALQYLQTDVIMMTSSLGAYCSGHPISSTGLSASPFRDFYLIVIVIVMSPGDWLGRATLQDFTFCRHVQLLLCCFNLRCLISLLFRRPPSQPHSDAFLGRSSAL